MPFPSLADSATEQAAAMRKAIELVGIAPFMTEVTTREQQQYPLQKSAVETVLSSPYVSATNTKTFHIALTTSWKSAVAKAYGKEQVRIEFLQQQLQQTISAYFCSYPPVRLLFEKGVKIDQQHMEKRRVCIQYFIFSNGLLRVT